MNQITVYFLSFLIFFLLCQYKAESIVVIKKDQEEKKVSLTANNTPVIAAIEILLPDGMTVVHDGTVDTKKTVTINFSDIPLTEALNLISEQAGIGWEKKGNVIILRGIVTETFSIPAPPAGLTYSAQFTESAIGTSGASGGATTPSTGATTQTIVPSTQTAQQTAGGGGNVTISQRASIDFWSDLRFNLDPIVKTKTPEGVKGEYFIDRSTSTITVTAPVPVMKTVRTIIKEITERLTKSVKVDVSIVEVISDEDKEFGLNWTTALRDTILHSVVTLTGAGQSLLTQQNLFSGSIKSISAPDKHSVVLSAIKRYADIKIVEKTSLLLRNNTAGAITKGTDRAYVDSMSQSVSEGVVTSSVSKGKVLTGISVYISASIEKDLVTLMLSPSISSLVSMEKITAGTTEIQNPTTEIRKSIVNVTLKSGETTAIVSVNSDKIGTDSKRMPILGDIPIIGPLFGWKKDYNSKSSILILLTPSIIKTTTGT